MTDDPMVVVMVESDFSISVTTPTDPIVEVQVTAEETADVDG